MATKIKSGSTNALNRLALEESCQLNELLLNISMRWKMQVLNSVADGMDQFSTLTRAYPSLSDQVLSKRLTELTTEGLLIKIVLKKKAPAQIRYELTEKGLSLLKILDGLHQWGLIWS